MNSSSDNSSSRPKRRRLLRIGIALFVLVLLLAGGAAATWFWVLPELVKDRLADQLGDRWNGTVEIDRVQLSLEGSQQISGIRLLDRRGRTWLDVKEITADLGPMRGLSPSIRVLEIDTPQLVLHVDRGQLRIPLRRQVHAETEKKKARGGLFDDLQNLRVRQPSIRIVEHDVEPLPPTDVPGPLERLELLRLHGSMDVKGEYELHLEPHPTNVLSVDASLRLEDVRIRDLRALIGMEPLGYAPDPLTIERLEIPIIRLSEDRLDVPRVRIHTGEGRFYAMGWLKFPGEGGEWEYDISAVWDDIDAATLYDAVDPRQSVDQGRAKGLAEVDGLGGGWAGMDFKGQVFFDEADLEESWLIAEILRTLNAPLAQIQGGSDLKLTFRIRDGVMELLQGHYGSNLAAIAVQPGGTVDLRDGQMDFYVLAGLLRNLRGIPVVNWFTNLAGNLTRLRVKGHWSEPPAALIRKEPVGDIGEGTVGFFRDVIKTGGELADIVVGLGSVFQEEPEKTD
jgi:hypothetical protein